MSPRITWPMPSDWATHRERISNLYRCHTLQQVQQIMASQHQFHATLRMYRSRLAAWDQDKNKKGYEMQNIAREAHRQKLNGQTPHVFFVRGKRVTYKSVEHYYRRRKMTMEQAIASPSEQNASLQDLEVAHSPSSPPIETPMQGSSASRASGVEGIAKAFDTTPPAQPRAVPRSPSPPSALIHPERALRETMAYVLGALEAQIWWSGIDTGHFLVSKMPSSPSPCDLYDNMNNLHTQAKTACDFFNHQCFEDGNILLAASIKGIKELVVAQWPPMPTYLPHTLHSILVRDKPEVALTILQQFIRLAEKYHGREHPMFQFCVALARVDARDLWDVVTCILAVVQDAFSRKLGALHRTSLATRYAYARTLWWRTSPVAYMREIEHIAEECQAELDAGDVRTITWRLHVARWILNPLTQSTESRRAEARQILSEERARLLPPSLDTEDISKFANVHNKSFVNEYKLAPDKQKSSKYAKINCRCTGTLSYIDHACTIDNLFWPRLYLWEGSRNAPSDEHGNLQVLQHTHSRPLLLQQSA